VTETGQSLGIETGTETGGIAKMMMTVVGCENLLQMITTVITALGTPRQEIIAGQAEMSVK
jgi:DNA-binding FrmR family transcriptional regulator